ncbi:MAG TPA: hypothetical protein VEA17_21830 [Bordetella sp.]|nr:hypothetical protein [Bordetella sp.]
MLALLFVVAFWLSTIVAELFLNLGAVAAVKAGIAYAMLCFVPIMMATAASGMVLGGKGRHPLIVRKKRRMPFIAANGLLVLVPAAVWLHLRAQEGLFDTAFYAVQAVELIAGAVNLVLICRNIRDGLKLAGATGRTSAVR